MIEGNRLTQAQVTGVHRRRRKRRGARAGRGRGQGLLRRALTKWSGLAQAERAGERDGCSETARPGDGRRARASKGDALSRRAERNPRFQDTEHGVPAAGGEGCSGADGAVDGVDQPARRAARAAQGGDRALPVRDHPPVLRRQRTYRAPADDVSAAPDGI